MSAETPAEKAIRALPEFLTQEAVSKHFGVKQGSIVMFGNPITVKTNGVLEALRFGNIRPLAHSEVNNLVGGFDNGKGKIFLLIEREEVLHTLGLPALEMASQTKVRQLIPTVG